MPEQQPYFRGQHIKMPCKAILQQPPTSAPVAELTVGLQHLSHWPNGFGTLAPDAVRHNPTAHCLYNSKLTHTARMPAHFDWAVYGFNSGHFWSTIQGRGLPFRVVLACYPFVHGCALFRNFSGCKIITNSAPAMLDYVCGSGVTSKLTGYLIHSHRYSSTEPTSRFWEIQFNIVHQLRIIWLLSIVVAFIHHDHDCCAIS